MRFQIRWTDDGYKVSIPNYDGGEVATADEFDALLARHNALKDATVHIYNSGYHAGHHDTVEGRYVDIHTSDMGTYHTEEVAELLAALVGEE